VTQAGAPIRVGLLGVGRIGRLHARLLATEVTGLTLAAVHDVDSDASAAVARDLGVDVAVSADELMERSDVDAIAICTSTDTHVDLLVAAVSTRKPVFLEKPVSLDLAELDRGLAAADDTGIFLQVGFNRRFDPAHRSVRDAVASGSIGDVHLVRISSRDPQPPPLTYVRVSGGIFLDMTVHDFDMARYLTGSGIDEVYARGEVRIDPVLADEEDFDTTLVVLRHVDSTLTAIDNSRRAAYGFDQRVEAFGSDGMAASENPLAHTGVLHIAGGTRSAALPHFFLERYVSSYVAEWEAFEEAVRADAGSPVPGVDGRAALVAGLAARRSALEGRPVRTTEIG
jgi:myo-inositol 2-dehydrogenase / D-chiro-inositol 1-dehydrogenase